MDNLQKIGFNRRAATPKYGLITAETRTFFHLDVTRNLYHIENGIAL